MLTSSGGAVETALYSTADTGSGNLTITASMRAGSGAPEALIVARATSTSWSTMSAYTLDLTVNNTTASGIAIGKLLSGSHSLLSGSRVGSLAAFPSAGAGYDLELAVSGSTVAVLVGYVRRRSDGNWLNSSGAWQASKAPAVSATDSSPLAANGYLGLAMYDFGGASGGFIDDFASTEMSFDYFVSSSGSDLDDGASPGTAWKTIAMVNSVAYAPGTTISFEGGSTFVGNVLIQSSGTAAAPVTITSYGTGRATINGGTGSGVEVRDAEFVVVRNLELVGSGVSTVDGSTSNTGAGIDLVSTATSGDRLRGCQVLDCEITGFRTGILVQANSGSYPQTSWRGFDGVTIARCEITLCSIAGIYTWALSNNTTFSGSDGTFPQLATDNSIHSNIHVVDVNVHDIYGFDGTGLPNPYQASRSGAGIRICNMNGGVIEHCRVDNAGHSGNAYQSPANYESEASLRLVWQFNESSNCVLYGNNDGAGFDVFDGGAQYGVVQYNWIHDNDGYGIGGGGVGSGFGGAIDGNVARFNVLSNNNRKGTTGDLQFWGDFTNLRVYGNTIYSSRNGSSLIAVVAAATSSWVANNILVSLGTRALLTSTQAAANTPRFVGNLYWRGAPTSNLGLTMNGTTSNTLAAWRAQGEEILQGAGTGMVDDPDLDNGGATSSFLPASPVSAMTDYDTNPTSPARGAALDLATTLGWDMGAFDFHANRFSSIEADLGAHQSTVR